MKMRRFGMLSCSLLAMAAATPAFAQAVEERADDGDAVAAPQEQEDEAETASDAPLSSRSFTPADFTQFAPQNALDMVSRIPGFNIQGGNDGSRGLGQANQNVLINGQRVSGKSNDAATALSRIPAGSVARIDLVDGATLAIPGLSGQVANIIANVGGWSGNFNYRPEFRRDDLNLFTAGEVSMSGSLGGSEVSISLRNNGFRNGHGGPELTRSADGDLLRSVDEQATYKGDQPQLAGSLARTADNGNILNINASVQINHFDRRVDGVETLADGSVTDELNTGSEREWNFELGGDYEFALAGGRLKLIGLRRYEHSPFKNAFTRLSRDPGAVITGSRFDQVLDEAETIARGEYSFNALGGDMQVSLEGAYNVLESEAELFVRDEFGDEQQVALPGANARVSEKRAESIVTYGRSLADDLSVQFGFGGEYSRITAGDLTRSFWRPKGSVSLAWTANDKLTVNAKVERRVDQLNFFDFLASVDVVDDNDRSNNFNLVPPQRWRGELQFVQSLGEWGSISPQIRVAQIDDIVDSIPVSPTEEARGNLDSAFVLQGILEGTLILDPIGFDGARMNIFMNVTDTSLTDPLTGEKRQISGIGKFNSSIGLRHDIPGSSWAWGTGLEFNEQGLNYRLDQTARGFQTKPFAWFYVEHKDVLGLTARASLLNLLGSRDGFERTVYVDRRDGPIAFQEEWERSFGPIVRFTISGNI